MEKDGSGDFTVIQDAVDASAPGDSVLIGPGRYTDTFPFATPVITVITHVGVSQGPLTILGVDSSQVIIGPVVPNLVGFGPKGISVGIGVAGVRIQNLTLENVHDAAFLGGGVTIHRCVFRGNVLGVFGSSIDPLSVGACSFFGNGIGVTTGNPTVQAEVFDSTFANNEIGVDLSQTTNGSVRNCTFQSDLVAVQFEQFTISEILGCTITNTIRCSISIALGSQATVTDNHVIGGECNLTVTASFHVEGSGNLFEGGRFTTLEFAGQATASLHDNQ
ncbi:MAG: NosD domain-containing protein, partial [Acidobacteriota bacterium]